MLVQRVVGVVAVLVKEFETPESPELEVVREELAVTLEV